jgi:hypothetical protein
MVQRLNQNGFENRSVHRFEYGKTMARFWNDMYLSAWEESAMVVLRDPVGSYQLGVAAMDEVRNGFCPELGWVARGLENCLTVLEICM